MNSSYQPFRIVPSKSVSPLRSALSVAGLVTLAIITGILLNTFVFQPYVVDGESMSPTLHTNDRLVVSRVERTLAEIQRKQYIPARGQIIVINGKASPETTERAPELIKRVIGLPGDTVSIAGGTVIVTPQNGTPIDINRTLGLELERTYSAEPFVVHVPDDSVYVLGDNREQGGSLDSRVFGPVKLTYIDGRLWSRIMPFTNLRVF